MQKWNCVFEIVDRKAGEVVRKQTVVTAFSVEDAKRFAEDLYPGKRVTWIECSPVRD